MENREHRDRAGYERLETSDIRKVSAFLEQNAENLETAELTVRSSAGSYIVEMRSTNETISISS